MKRLIIPVILLIFLVEETLDKLMAFPSDHWKVWFSVIGTLIWLSFVCLMIIKERETYKNSQK